MSDIGGQKLERDTSVLVRLAIPGACALDFAICRLHDFTDILAPMNDSFSESTSQIIRSGRVKTSSLMYKIWLSTFRGFVVERKIQTPKGYSFGRLTYKTSWVLRPKKLEAN